MNDKAFPSSKQRCEHLELTKCDNDGEGAFYWICVEPGCDFKTPEFNPDSSKWLPVETTDVCERSGDIYRAAHPGETIVCPGCGKPVTLRTDIHATQIPRHLKRSPEEPSEANSLKCVSAGCANNCEKGNPYLCSEHARSSEKAAVCTCASSAAGPCPAHT